MSDCTFRARRKISAGAAWSGAGAWALMAGLAAAAVPPSVPPSVPPAPPAPDAAPAQPGAAPTPDSGAAGKKPPGARTLDDLLGITPVAPAPEAPAAEGDADRDRLDKTLREEEVDDTFTQAVEAMRRSMERLGVRGDAGVETQRVQEEAVKRLDALIDAARKQRQRQQQQQSSRSRPRDRQSEEEQAQRDEASGSQQQPGARPEGDGRREQARRAPGSRQGEVEPPELAEGALDEVMQEGRIEWGNLPPRIREIVQQGRRDRVSSLYLRLTEEYYRRMAEEASK